MDAKSADHFNAGNLHLLAQLCELTMIQRDAMAQLVKTPTDGKLGRLCASYATAIAGLSSKLRLSIQSAVRGDAGKLNETAPRATPLLGGNVTRLRRA